MSWIKDALAGGGTEIQQKAIEVTVNQPDNDLLIYVAVASGIIVPILLWWLNHRVRKRNK